jgi:NitT/TauT family transport system permease protein
MSIAPQTDVTVQIVAGDAVATSRPRAAERLLDSLTVVVVLVALWQLVYWRSEVAITGPIETVKTAAALLGSESFWQNALASGRAFGLSLIISSIGGVAVGLALGAHRFSGAVAAPILTAFYTIPKVTLYPMVLLIFGLGISAKVAFGVMHGIIPVVIFTMDAVRNVNPVWVKTGRILKLSPAQMATRILVPAVMPEIVTGLRVGFSLTLLGVVIGEMFASQQGLGFMIMNGMNVHNVRTLTAVVLLLVLFAVASSIVLLAIERRLRPAAKAPVGLPPSRTSP